MQEIPEVDWKRIYQFVARWRRQHPHAPLVVNWNDLPVWYLGESPRHLYLLRQIQTARHDPLSGAPIINSLADFQNLIRYHPHGLVVIDSWDDRLPVGIRPYCRQHLQHQLEIRQLYPRQPRPWPVNIYSW